MQLLMMRHGRSLNNEREIISHTPDCWPLTSQGRMQARHRAESLRGHNITDVVVSPLLRAQQTAAIVTEKLGLDIKPRCDNSLTEINMGCYTDTTAVELIRYCWRYRTPILFIASRKLYITVATSTRCRIIQITQKLCRFS